MAKGKVLAKALGKGTAKNKGLTKKELEKATQKGVRFRKKYEAKEGAGLASEGGGSVQATRASGTRGEKVTVGSKSYTNFINDQMAIFRGKPDRASVIRRRVLKKITEAEQAGDTAAVKKLRAFADKLEDAGIKKGEAEAAATARKISASTRGKPKGEKRTDYVDPETGEIFGKPTERQIKQASTNFRARGKTGKARELDAFLEEQRIKSGKLKPGESGVGPRRGSRGMSSGIRAEDRASIKDPINKKAKGGYMKKNKGSMDYRKGGLLMSSVDNRKKR